MSRYVKISAIGVEPMQINADAGKRGCGGGSASDIWNRMKDILITQIEQVLPDRPDLIVLPEMCDTPSFGDTGAAAAYIDGRGDANVRLFSSIAKENNCNIAFSTIRRGKGDYFINSACVLNRSGGVAGWYDKNHLPISEMTKNVRCGTGAELIELDFGKVACAICFDLNYTGLMQRYADQKPDLIIFMSMFHGALLQQIWAHLCKSYFVGAISNSRPSAILSPMGDTLAYSTNYRNFATASVNLDYAFAHYDFNFEKFKLLKAYYGGGVTLFDPGNIGYVMISSETAGVSAGIMLEKFQIEPLDAYLERSLSMHMDAAYRDV